MKMLFAITALALILAFVRAGNAEETSGFEKYGKRSDAILSRLGSVQKGIATLDEKAASLVQRTKLLVAQISSGHDLLKANQFEVALVREYETLVDKVEELTAATVEVSGIQVQTAPFLKSASEITADLRLALLKLQGDGEFAPFGKAFAEVEKQAAGLDEDFQAHFQKLSTLQSELAKKFPTAESDLQAWQVKAMEIVFQIKPAQKYSFSCSAICVLGLGIGEKLLVPIQQWKVSSNEPEPKKAIEQLLLTCDVHLRRAEALHPNLRNRALQTGKLTFEDLAAGPWRSLARVQTQQKGSTQTATLTNSCQLNAAR